MLPQNAHFSAEVLAFFFCYSSTTRHSAMVPTVTRPSAQAAIVKIRRVDRLYAFTALLLLLLLVEGADK
jgi:hypothetical protein